MVSLALHYKLLGVLLLLIMVHKLILVIPKSCDVLFATLIQLMLMLIMFPVGKIRALWTITKTMGHFLWKNMYIMNMWKRVEGGICCCHTKLNHHSYNKIDPAQQTFFEDLLLYITIHGRSTWF